MISSARLEALEHRRLLAAYYLSPGGDDAAAGTLDAPWRTLNHAASRVAAGDEVVLRSGTYAGGATFNVPNLTIRSHDGERGTVSAPINEAAVQWALRLGARAAGATIRNVEVVGGYYYAIKLESEWGWGPNAARNVTIEDSVLHGSGRDVIKITPGCDDVVIRRNQIYDSGLRDGSNAEGIDNVNGDRMLVQDNTFRNVATNAVYAKGGAIGCVIERNTVDTTGSLGIVLGFTTDGEFFDPDANPGGYESIDGTVRNNVIRNSRYGGIGLYSALRARVYNNTVLNAANQGQAGVVIAPGWEYNPTGRLVPTKDAEIVNNVIGVSGAYPFVQIREAGLDPSGTLVMANNHYYRQGPAAADFRDDRGGARWTGTLAQWQAHVGTDLTSTQGDPGVDAGGRPTASSPLIDAGATLSSFNDDVDRQQRPMGRAWDIGADEVDGEVQPDTTPPALLARAPAVGAANVPAGSNTSATFNEAVQADGVTFTLVGPGGVVVPSAVTYAPATRTFTLDPAADLALSTTYTVNLAGVRDTAGNTAAPVSWTFTTAWPPTTVFSAVPGEGDFANYTPLVASRWAVTTEGGDMRLLLASTTHTGRAADLLGEYALLNGWTAGDFDLTLRARTNEDLAANPSADYALVFGHVDANNYSYLMMNSRAANTRLFTVVDGVPTAHPAATAAGVPDAGWHGARITRAGSTVTVALDGATILSQTDPAFARAGGVGVGSYNDSAYFDDVDLAPAGAGARVTDVFVAGSAWGTAFRRAILTQSLGSDDFGYRVGAAGAVPEVVPWTNVNQITVRFDRPVTLTADDVVVRSLATGAAYAVSGVIPGASGATATIRLARALQSDRVEVVLSGSAGGGAALDGEFGGTLSSGNGSPGGDFAFRFNVLHGDVDRDGTVGSRDLASIRYRVGQAAAQAGPGSRPYGVFHDLDGSGTVAANDLATVRAGQGRRLAGITAGLFSRRTIYAATR